MKLSSNEQNYLLSVFKKVKDAGRFMDTNLLDENSVDPAYWYQYLATIKRVLGNFANDVSFAACLMAKEFIMSRHQVPTFDAASKTQSAPGLDIDVMTVDGKRVIGEIKTTISYYDEKDLGANQKKMFDKDFEKLAVNKADYKYFFVTEKETFEVVKKRHLDKLKDVTVVLLPQAFQEENVDLYVTVVPSSEGSVFRFSHTQLQTHLESKSSEPKLSDQICQFIMDKYVNPARKGGQNTNTD